MLKTIPFLTILLLLLLYFLNRERIRYWVALLQERGWRSTVHYDRCLTIFKKLYEGVDAYQVSKAERDHRSLSDSGLIYGEVVFYSFVRLLELAKPQSGEIFYDLGSGAGKAVFIAGLVFNFSKACGIEKLEGLYQLSQQLNQKLRALPERQSLIPDKPINVEFSCSDFREVDYSDADIIFINATCWIGEILNATIIKLEQLKQGARVIITTADLNGINGFQLTYTNLHLMSWGVATVRIYERV